MHNSILDNVQKMIALCQHRDVLNNQHLDIFKENFAVCYDLQLKAKHDGYDIVQRDIDSSTLVQVTDYLVRIYVFHWKCLLLKITKNVD